MDITIIIILVVIICCLSSSSVGAFFFLRNKDEDKKPTSESQEDIPSLPIPETVNTQQEPEFALDVNNFRNKKPYTIDSPEIQHLIKVNNGIKYIDILTKKIKLIPYIYGTLRDTNNNTYYFVTDGKQDEQSRSIVNFNELFGELKDTYIKGITIESYLSNGVVMKLKKTDSKYPYYELFKINSRIPRENREIKEIIIPPGRTVSIITQPNTPITTIYASPNTITNKIILNEASYIKPLIDRDSIIVT